MGCFGFDAYTCGPRKKKKKKKRSLRVGAGLGKKKKEKEKLGHPALTTPAPHNQRSHASIASGVVPPPFPSGSLQL